MEQPAYVFTGFVPPTENWSKLPHALIEALPLIETVGEMKVILYILRHTWGYHDSEKKITLDEFEHGRKRRDGTRLDNGTGLSHGTIKDGLQRAERHGFIEIAVDERDLGRIKKYYSLKNREPNADLQGVKTCPPDRQAVTPRPPIVAPRTEKETIETNQETNTKGESPVAPAPSPNGDPPTIPSSFREWEEWLKRVSNKPALVRRMCGVLYPDKELPAYGHIGTVAKKAGRGIDGYRRVMAVLWTLSVAEPAKGDLMPYVQRVIEGKDRDNGANRRRSKGKPPPIIDGWDKFDVPIPGHVDAG